MTSRNDWAFEPPSLLEMLDDLDRAFGAYAQEGARRADAWARAHDHLQPAVTRARRDRPRLGAYHYRQREEI
jgi:hypothetical protein